MTELSSLHDIALFVEVARLSSFTRAAKKLGVSAATLSRRIAAMEGRFATRLFNRTTRRVELTDAGRRYFDRCEHLADDARRAEEVLADASQRAVGCLRVSMPVDLGLHHIGPLLPEFARLHPAVTFELDLSPHHRDLVGEQVDVAIRLGRVTAQHLFGRRVGWVEQRLFASPAYLERRGRPSQPADLSRHDCIVVPAVGGPASWRLARQKEIATVAVRGTFAVNNQGLMRSLCERGVGIAALASTQWREPVREGRLVPVLPDWAAPRLAVRALTASRLQPARVQAFVGFLAERFASM